MLRGACWPCVRFGRFLGLIVAAVPAWTAHVCLASDPPKPQTRKTALPAGERPQSGGKKKAPPFKLMSGKLFKADKTRSHTSTDGGKTWVAGGKFDSYRPLWTLANAPIQIREGKYRGRIVIPFYTGLYADHPDYTREQRGGYAIWKGKKILLETHTHIPEMCGTFFVYSEDEGRSWKASKGALVGYFKDGHMGHMSCEEPVVAELKDGRLLCYMRSTCGRILKSYSSDGGLYWSKVELTDLAMSNSPCAMVRVPKTGDLVLVWNQMSAEEIKRGYRRGRLTVAVSTDDGQTWTHRKNLEVSPGCDATVTHVAPPPLQAMVRGPSGPDNPMGEIPDGFTHFHYPGIYFGDGGETIDIYYLVSTPGKGRPPKWRTFPVEWLYED